MFRILSNVGSQLVSTMCKMPPAPISAPSRAPTISAFLPLLTPKPVLNEQVRTVIKYSMAKGTRKTVHPVVKRFFRLHWGAWIRTKAARFRKLWAKTPQNRRAKREHVFCNATQSKLLDRMVCEFWRRPKYYINDPYAPYHTREEFRITRKKPWRPEGWE